MPAPLSPLAPLLLALLKLAQTEVRPDGRCDTLAVLKHAYRLRAQVPRGLQGEWDGLVSEVLAEACRDPEPEPTA
jgi:hypothetical protein